MPDDATVDELESVHQFKEQEVSGFYQAPIPPADREDGDEIVAFVAAPDGAPIPDDLREFDRLQWDGLDRSQATEIIYSPSVTAVEPVESDEATAKHGKRPTRKPDRRSVPDHHCFNSTFCLFKNDDFEGGHLYIIASDWAGQGWKGLASYDFSNATNSVANGYTDAKLARNADGSGIDYCSEGDTEDSTLGNNDIGNNLASSFRISLGFNTC